MLLVCDNMVHVKMLPCIEELIVGVRKNPPYNGAKPHYVIGIEDGELIEKVIRVLEQNTPLPKHRKKKQ